MNFKDFYKNIYFDVDDTIMTVYSAKQGDMSSRGFYITLLQNGKIIPVTTQSMVFYADKPDKTRILVSAVVDGERFRVDLPHQTFAVDGTLQCELTLNSNSGERISSKTFKMQVDRSLQERSLVSKDERGVIDELFEILDVTIPNIERLEDEWKTNDNARIAAENTRKSNENTRISNENSRKTAEQNRVVAETNRHNTFTQKINDFVAETKRVESQYPVKLTEIESNLNKHINDNMPHKVKDLKSNKKYKFGLQLSTSGNPQLIFEEE